MRHLTGCLVMLALTAASANAQVEIAYDDGTAETGIVWETPRNGVAVRFTAPGCVLTGAKFFTLLVTSWYPVGYCVLDANGPGGAPGDTLLGYSEVPLERTHAYQEATFPAPITVPHADFYVVYLQTSAVRFDSNVYGIDTSSSPDGRSWLFQGGVWSLMAPSQGDVMIRALVLQPVPTEIQTWGALKGTYR